MRRLAWLVACWGVLLGTAAPGQAGPEEDPAGEALIRAALDALHSPEADVRQAATSTLWNLRERAVGPLVDRARKATEEEREGLLGVARLLAESVLKVLDELPASDRMALSWLRTPLEAEGSVDPRRLVDRLFGKEDPQVAAEVRALFERLPRNTWTSDHPTTSKIVRMGRPAVPTLLLLLAPTETDSMAMGPMGAVGMHPRWASSALRRLLDERDVPALGQLLELGWDGVVHVLQGLAGSEAASHLLMAARRGPMTSDLASALHEIGSDEALEIALHTLKNAKPQDLPDGDMHLLELVVDKQATQIIPCVHRWLEATAPEGPEWYGPRENLERARLLGVWAGIQVGDLRSLPLAIEGLGATGFNDWLARFLGEALDRVTGQDLWRGEAAPARMAYRAWWKAHEGRLTWNADARRFRVRDR